ncbi:hypothetical protein L1887_44557 [Cichorium endivia]|nr:hypothetical protein L1887_44557 [Cichorium endivia]
MLSFRTGQAGYDERCVVIRLGAEWMQGQAGEQALEYKKSCDWLHPGRPAENERHEGMQQRLGVGGVLVGDVEQEGVGVEQHLVVGAGLREDGGNVASRLELSELEEALVLLDGLADEFGGLGLTLRLDDDRGLLLDGLVDEEGGTQRGLLCDLLRLDGVGEFGREGDVGDGDVIEDEVEALGACGEVVAHQSRHHLSLGDELGGVELGDDRLEHLVHDRGQHALVVVRAELAEDGGERIDAWTREHTAGERDHLEILGAARVLDGTVTTVDVEERHVDTEAERDERNDTSRAAEDVGEVGRASTSSAAAASAASAASTWLACIVELLRCLLSLLSQTLERAEDVLWATGSAVHAAALQPPSLAPSIADWLSRSSAFSKPAGLSSRVATAPKRKGRSPLYRAGGATRRIGSSASPDAKPLWMQSRAQTLLRLLLAPHLHPSLHTSASFLPSSPSLAPATMTAREARTVIVITGSHTITAGYGIHEILKRPSISLTARVGLPRSAASGSSSSSSPPDYSQYLVGSALDEAERRGDDVAIFWPMRKGYVRDWQQMIALWNYVLFHLLPIRRSHNDSNVLISLPLPISRATHAYLTPGLLRALQLGSHHDRREAAAFVLRRRHHERVRRRPRLRELRRDPGDRMCRPVQRQRQDRRRCAPLHSLPRPAPPPRSERRQGGSDAAPIYPQGRIGNAT